MRTIQVPTYLLAQPADGAADAVIGVVPRIATQTRRIARCMPPPDRRTVQRKLCAAPVLTHMRRAAQIAQSSMTRLPVAFNSRVGPAGVADVRLFLCTNSLRAFGWAISRRKRIASPAM